MRACLAAFAFSLIASAIAPAHASDAGGCDLRLAAALRMQADIGGRPLVSVKVDGRDRFLLVDTGAISTMLTHDTAQELRLPTRPVRSGSFIFSNGDSASATARVNSFQIGRLPFGEFTFLVTPRSMRLPGAAGALGPDIMRLFDVELDFAANRFNLFAQDHCDGGVVHWTKRPHASMSFAVDGQGHMTTVAMLDGKLVDILIDTGAVMTTMMLEDAQSEFGVATTSSDVTLIHDGGGDMRDAVYLREFRTLDLEGISIARPTISLRPDRTGLRAAGLRPEVILGMSELRKLHLYIAYREKKLYITGANDR